MRKRLGRAAELCGAVIGAGFATGQEIAAFFSRYGAWSWLGVAVAVLTLAMLGTRLVRCCTRHGVNSLAALCEEPLRSGMQVLFILLLMVTGGAMLAGSGEVLERLLPLRGPILGAGATLLFSMLLAQREGSGLRWLSGALMVLLLAVMALCLLLPQGAAVTLSWTARMPWLAACWRGMCWSGFNAATIAPLLCEERDEAVPCWTALLVGVLLGLGNLLLLRHPERLESTLPMATLFSALGKAGYLCGVTAMYLAMVTTLIAALRGLQTLLRGGERLRCGLAALLIAAVACTGFNRIVERGYSLLGGACLALLLVLLVKNRQVARK